MDVDPWAVDLKECGFAAPVTAVVLFCIEVSLLELVVVVVGLDVVVVGLDVVVVGLDVVIRLDVVVVGAGVVVVDVVVVIVVDVVVVVADVGVICSEMFVDGAVVEDCVAVTDPVEFDCSSVEVTLLGVPVCA